VTLKTFTVVIQTYPICQTLIKNTVRCNLQHLKSLILKERLRYKPCMLMISQKTQSTAKTLLCKATVSLINQAARICCRVI